jgi:hypothetical protein
MTATKPPFVSLSLSLAAALLVTACARPLDMSVASLHQRPAEFDFLVYQDGWACLSGSAPSRDGGASACTSGSGRQMREFFAQRSSSRPLREYLTANGASCRSGTTATTCSYTKTLETPLVFGRRVNSSGDEGLELTVTFPAQDRGLAPGQITTALKRVTRTS